MSAGGPPPGGYGFGLIDPEKKPGPKKAEPEAAPRPIVDPYAPPKVSPFGGSNYVPEGMGARPRRWVGLPIIGIGLLCVRVLLLCARTNSSPSYPSYTPSYNYPDLSLPAPAAAAPKTAPVVAGSLAASRDGAVFWFDGTTLVRRDPAKKESRLDIGARRVTGTQPQVDALSADGNRACWIENRSSIHCVEDTRTMASDRLLFAGSAGLGDVQVDADAAYFIEEAWKDSGTVYTVSRVDFRSRTHTELVTGGSAHHLALDATNVYFVSGQVTAAGKGDVAISRVAKTGGVAKVIASLGARTPESLTVQGSELFFTAPGGVDDAYAMQLFRLPKVGGAATKVNLGDEEVSGPFAVNDKSIYFVGAGDTLYRVGRAGGTPSEVPAVSGRVARLTLTSKGLEYVTAGQRAPQTAALLE